MLWRESNSFSKAGRAIADRHYNRQHVGSARFVPPGRCLVLLTEGALWVTSWPFAEYVRHAWAGAWVCSCFRNESPHLASVLIRQAIAATRFKWPEVPQLGMVTFIDRSKVRPTMVRGKPTWGRTYKLAGFIDAVCPEHQWSASHCGPPRDCAACRSETAGGLYAVQIFEASMPVASPANGVQRVLFC